jgi:hypothetical protein
MPPAHHPEPGPHSNTPDHLDDLRAQLPAEFRGAPETEVAQLWVAWDAARHRHPVSYLTDTLDVPPEIAERLIALAQLREHEREP